jgi:hypothetical protein
VAGPTAAELQVQLAELRAAKHQMLLAPLKGTVGDDTYDNTGRLAELNKEIKRLEDELRRAQAGRCSGKPRRVI